jgi:hypothetical protein
MHLINPAAPHYRGSDLVLAADCVAYALGDFHARFLKGKTLAIACPKLDDVEPHVRKLAAIFGQNEIRSITVAIMEVPCCRGLLRAVEEALTLAGRTDIPVETVIVGVQGSVLGCGR